MSAIFVRQVLTVSQIIDSRGGCFDVKRGWRVHAVEWIFI